MKQFKRNFFSALMVLTFCICLGMIGQPMNASAASSQVNLNLGQWRKQEKFTKNIDTKYYKVTLPKAGSMTMRGVVFDGEYEIELLLADKKNGYMASWLGGGTESKPMIWTDSLWLEKGIYYIKIRAEKPVDAGKFWIKADFRPIGSNETEPNNTFSRANRIPLDQKRRGLCSPEDYYDYYTFTLSKKREVTVHLTTYFGGCSIDVYNSKKKNLAKKEWLAGREEAPDATSIELDLPAGKYYVRVGSMLTGYYDLEVKTIKTLVEEIILKKQSAEIYRGDKLKLNAYVFPTYATNRKVTWTSSNTRVATVSSTGLVTAKAAGTAKIIARTTDGTKLTASCRITVRDRH